MRAPRWWPERGLWRNPAFLHLWTAQAVSAFGSRFTRTALPIVAVLTLHERDTALGALAALALGSAVATAIVSGGFVDRGDKRSILVGCDLARAALVASLPLAAWLGHLTMEHVCAVAAAVGSATSLFSITDGAFLPALVGTAHLAEGNSKLEATEATVEIAGPAAAGAVIGALGAPLALLFDAATYLWSAALLARIRAGRSGEPAYSPKPTPRARTSFGADLRFGLRVVFGHPVLRRLAIAEMAQRVAGGFFMALYSLYCLRDLHLSPAVLGAVVSVGGVGALIGAAFAPRVARAFGLGKTLLALATIGVGGLFLIPAAASFGGAGALVALVAHQLFGDGAEVAYEVNAVTLRQTVLPTEELGRANAALLACTSAAMFAAALGGGLIGSMLGTRAALVVGPVLGLAAPLALFGLRTMKAIGER